MNRLAHAYRLKGDRDAADKAFQAIIDAFPGTRKAESAESYIGWTPERDQEDSSDDGGSEDNE